MLVPRGVVDLSHPGEGLPGLVPLLRHLVEVGRPPQQL